MVTSLYDDGPQHGPANMALDQALLEEAADGTAALRLYTWRSPTLSLGYFQSLADRQLHPASLDCPVVRRWSGGGAIVHDCELTYSLAMPQADRWSERADRLYTLVHATIVRALARQAIWAHAWPAADSSGPTSSAAAEAGGAGAGEPSDHKGAFLCFQRRSAGDLVVGEAKVVGSAQRRLRGGLLQHGSILWRRSPQAPELPGLADLSEREPAWDRFRSDWLELLAAALGTSWQLGSHPDRRLDRSAEIERQVFANSQWTGRR